MPGLQPGAFATQRHLTIKNPWCFARRTGLEPAVMVSQGWLTATCLTIRLISEQSIKKTSAVSSATHFRRTVLLPLVNRLPVRDCLPASPQATGRIGFSCLVKSSSNCQRAKWILLIVLHKNNSSGLAFFSRGRSSFLVSLIYSTLEVSFIRWMRPRENTIFGIARIQTLFNE